MRRRRRRPYSPYSPIQSTLSIHILIHMYLGMDMYTLCIEHIIHAAVYVCTVHHCSTPFDGVHVAVVQKSPR